MNTYSSIIRVESVAYPGATIVIRAITEGLRSRVDTQILVYQKQKIELAKKINLLRASDALKADCAAIEALGKGATTEEQEAIDKKTNAIVSANRAWEDVMQLQLEMLEVQKGGVHHTYIEQALVRVDGFELTGLDGAVMIKPKPADWIELGPPALYAEALLAIKQELGLSPREAENLGSPSTSSGQADGKTVVSSATLAAA